MAEFVEYVGVGSVDFWNMVFAVCSLVDSCKVGYRSVRDDTVFSVWSSLHNVVGSVLYVEPDLAMFPTLLLESLHAPDSDVHMRVFHDIRCTRVCINHLAEGVDSGGCRAVCRLV